MSVTDRLRSVFGSVFDIDAAALTDDDTYETIPGWDSVNHISLILALEAEFEVQFDPGEIAEMTSFGAIRARVEGAGTP
jgi:acyl carrier protein